jgi:hypothetical protein
LIMTNDVGPFVCFDCGSIRTIFRQQVVDGSLREGGEFVFVVVFAPICLECRSDNCGFLVTVH